ncbi:MAG: DUF2167 domain-containing protein [Cytophagales bacterium]
MNKTTIGAFLMLANAALISAQNVAGADSLFFTSKSGKDSLVTIPYYSGKISLANNVAEVDVPQGYKFYKTKEAKQILETIWGNPEGNTDGLLMPLDITPVTENAWGIEYSYDGSGYVKDEDAKDINYDELLEDMKKDTKDGNAERLKAGYTAIELVGWAVKPFYDETNKKLHWAKEIKFGTDSINTLNYNIRILGRKGVMVMNVIANMQQLKMVNAEMPKLLKSTNFTAGNTYKEFDSSIDEVAAYTVGGLIAGKVLAKAGLFAFFGKFIKLIIVAVGAGAMAVWKWITGAKKKKEEKESAITLDKTE